MSSRGRDKSGPYSRPSVILSRYCPPAFRGRDKSGPYARPSVVLYPLLEPRLFIRYEHVADIFAGTGDHQVQIFRLGGGQIFEAVYRQVDASLVERALDFSNKNAIAADF